MLREIACVSKPDLFFFSLAVLAQGVWNKYVKQQQQQLQLVMVMVMVMVMIVTMNDGKDWSLSVVNNMKKEKNDERGKCREGNTRQVANSNDAEILTCQRSEKDTR